MTIDRREFIRVGAIPLVVASTGVFKPTLHRKKVEGGEGPERCLVKGEDLHWLVGKRAVVEIKKVDRAVDTWELLAIKYDRPGIRRQFVRDIHGNLWAFENTTGR